MDRHPTHCPTSSHRLTGLRPLMLAAALAFGGFSTMAVHAQPSSGTSADGTLLSISAEGEVHQAPDIARLSTGVVTQAADANAAMRANAEQMTVVAAALKAAGIASRDIQTSGVNLHPQYRHDEGNAPTITGYQANNTFNIVVRDIGKLGQVMDALVAAGANQIIGPSFDIDDKTASLDEARRKAVEQARQRATMYASTLDLRVRRIVSISEGGHLARPMPMMAMGRAEKGFDTPISPGENTLSVNLDIVFELGK